MKGYIKINFDDEDSFTIFYVTKEEYMEEADFKALFKMFNEELITKYDYQFDGFYEVDIYHNPGIYIFEFNYIDSYGRNDFDVTLTINSTILYEFYDMDLINDSFIYYSDKYYIEIDKVIDDIRLFEYGNIVYGKSVNKILNLGILIT